MTSRQYTSTQGISHNNNQIQKELVCSRLIYLFFLWMDRHRNGTIRSVQVWGVGRKNTYTWSSRMLHPDWLQGVNSFLTMDTFPARHLPPHLWFGLVQVTGALFGIPHPKTVMQHKTVPSLQCVITSVDELSEAHTPMTQTVWEDREKRDKV